MKRSSFTFLVSLLVVFLSSCNDLRPSAFKILLDRNSIGIGETTQLVSDVIWNDGTRTRVTPQWISRDEKVARVEQDGRVIGQSAGKAAIAACIQNYCEAVSIQILATQIEPISAGTLRVHYQRNLNDYNEWGLHIWGSAVTPTDWNAPILFENKDSFGQYVEIPVTTTTSDPAVSFVIHRGDTKDIGTERSFPNITQYREIWLKEGRNEIWTSRPSSLPEVIGATMESSSEIHLKLSNELVPSAADIAFQDETGRGYPIAKVEKSENGIILRFKKPLDLSHNYLVSFGSASQYAQLTPDILDENYYDGKDLGATILSNGEVQLKLWSPPATKVMAILFDKQDQEKEIGRITLTRGANGVWSTVLRDKIKVKGGSNYDGTFYQYEVTAYGKTQRALDPYAKSMAAFNPQSSDKIGKSAIIYLNRSNPVGFDADSFRNTDIMKNSSDFVGYEIHVRDFTSDPASGVAPELRGTFLGFKQKVAYLRDLGVTHVQLLPVQNFYTVNETDRKFTDGTNTTFNYNWGYDPQNYFTPEGWFSTNAKDPYARIREYKELVSELHKNGIGVIMDVVYNHTFNSTVFENACQGCYYRKDNSGNISYGTGAGPTLDSRRLMVRKLIVDSVKYFADEYHINGYRFDLMGFMDIETMKSIRQALGTDPILYGEAWEFTDLPKSEATTKSNLPDGYSIGAFADTTRDSFAGRMETKGFVQGSFIDNHKVRSGIIGNLALYDPDYDGNGLPNTNLSEDPYDRFAKSPEQNLGFLTVHDGYTLWDKINLSIKTSPAERASMARMAMAMLMTSQGRILLQGGDEMGRTKPLAKYDPESSRAHTTPEVTEDEDLPGVKTFHENSYKSPDYTNMVRWNRLEKAPFSGIHKYVKELIAIRRGVPALRYATTAEVNKGLRFLGEQEPKIVINPTFGYASFSEVPSLTIRFSNGPQNQTLYLVGEIYPVNNEKNPVHSDYPIIFDSKGNGSITFNKTQIEKFDLTAWSDPDNLQVKLVATQGQWDTPAGAYSGMGNNTIKPKFIDKANGMLIDLSVMDDSPGSAKIPENPFIAFGLDNDVVPVSDRVGTLGRFSKLIVVFNPGITPIRLTNSDLSNPAEWSIMADNDRADLIQGLSDSAVLLEKGVITIPARSNAIIAKKAP